MLALLNRERLCRQGCGSDMPAAAPPQADERSVQGSRCAGSLPRNPRLTGSTRALPPAPPPGKLRRAANHRAGSRRPCASRSPPSPSPRGPRHMWKNRRNVENPRRFADSGSKGSKDDLCEAYRASRVASCGMPKAQLRRRRGRGWQGRKDARAQKQAHGRERQREGPSRHALAASAFVSASRASQAPRPSSFCAALEP